MFCHGQRCSIVHCMFRPGRVTPQHQGNPGAGRGRPRGPVDAGHAHGKLGRPLDSLLPFVRGNSATASKRRLLCDPLFIEGMHTLAPFSADLQRWHNSVTARRPNGLARLPRHHEYQRPLFSRGWQWINALCFTWFGHELGHTKDYLIDTILYREGVALLRNAADWTPSIPRYGHALSVRTLFQVPYVHLYEWAC